MWNGKDRTKEHDDDGPCYEQESESAPNFYYSFEVHKAMLELV